MRELARLSWPIAISTISYSVMTLVDTLFVGWLGPAQLAGVGLGGTAAFAVLCFAFGVLRGAKTLVAQAVGAGRRDEIAPYLGASLALAIGLGVASMVLAFGVAQVLPMISATPAAGEHARTYLVIRMLGAVPAMIYVALREVRYGVGDARSPMVAAVVANVANIVLCWIFVRELGWGVAGAAAATAIAHGIEGALLLYTQWSEGLRVRGTRMAHLRAVMAMGFPTGVQFLLEVGSFAMLAALISAMSETQMAAHQIALQLIHFSFLPAFAVAEAANVMAGQAVGAGQPALVLGVARRAVAATSVYTGVCTLAFIFGGGWIVSGFTGDAALRQIAVHLLWVAAIFQVFDGANVVARGVLRGTGDVVWPAWVGILTAWVATPPLTWLLGWHFGLGALGGWIGLCAEIIVGAAILWWRLERGGWKRAAAASRARVADEEGAVGVLAGA